jgi:hypothetical protein
VRFFARLRGPELRLLLIGAVAIAAIWFGVVGGWLDRRPVQRVLYLGHSLTYYNDMPSMIAKIADSAGSPIHYDVTMRAFPNARLEDHWKNRETRELLLRGGWDMVILQPESHFNPQYADSSLYIDGSKLLAGAAGARRVIVISWVATESHYPQSGTTRSEHFAALENNLRSLANQNGADVIDLARVWDRVRAEKLPFPLYKDGNHPSLEGSYLAALVVYASISRANVGAVTYVPWGMSNDHAALLRQRVNAALN